MAVPTQTIARSMGDDASALMSRLSELDNVIAQAQAPELLTELGVFIRRAFDASKNHRQMIGVDNEMIGALRAVKRQYGPDERALFDPEEGPEPVYAGVTNMKVRALQSWILDILTNNEDKPWTIQPTPMPSLPMAAEDAVVDQLEQEIMAEGGVIPPDVNRRALALKNIAKIYVDKAAREAASRAEQKISDHLQQGEWRSTFEGVIQDLSMYPGCVMKGPYIEKQRRLVWSGDKVVPVEADIYRVRRVSPFDFYPSPNSTNCQNGDYVIERMRLSKGDLFDSTRLAGFQEMAIRQTLLAYPRGVKDLTVNDGERTQLEGTAQTNVSVSYDDRYDVLCFYGRVDARLLLLHGVDAGDPQSRVEAEVWTCGNMVIRALLNPHPLDRRPYQSASFEPVPGSFWGNSLPDLLKDIQRVCNSVQRAIVRNMAYSSGPIGEYDVNRMANEEEPSAVRPYRMYAVEADQTNPTAQAAMRFYSVPSTTAALSAVYEQYMKMADDVSGIPAYVLGNAGTAGAGRTLGGLSMLMGNAAKGVKKVIANIDKNVTEPMITDFYTLILLFDDDASLKGDVQVVARGSAGLLQRELSQARAVEVLQILHPYAQMGLIPPDGLKIVLRDILRGLGYSADEIVPDPARAQQVAQAGQPQAPGTPQGAPPQGRARPSAQLGKMPDTPIPTGRSPAEAPVKLDGRSAPANTAGAIQIPAVP